MDEHKGEEIKGRVEEGVGDITGNERLKNEGRVDKGSAKTKEAVDHATEKVKETIKPKP